ncbi:arsenate reductase/protein-tyrosine-phosphatase family protein [Brachybacterium sp. AOP43-C2-M15]|uniref:arsenate reductase/protein-tyrosine-phosphatase family protein n=1 Tax=Brachybacterium sp. AOP43-C2-M15 TaxID=3457661 RepID=UPI0040341674
MSSELLLVVCAANVCRSPLAELLLRQGLSDMPDIRIESAGVRVKRPARICELVADREADAAWRRAADDHRSRFATRELVQDATLVLAADRAVRSAIVRSTPESRDRVFMLRDAATLAENFFPDEPTRSAGVVSRLAMHLDRNRALRGPRHRGRGSFWGHREADRSSIEDGHGSSSRRHGATLDEVAASAGAITAALVGDRSS